MLHLRRNLADRDQERGAGSEPGVLLPWKRRGTLLKYAIAIFFQRRIFYGKS